MKIFSIEKNYKHITFKIFGIKLSIKLKPNPKEYYNYLENRKQYINDFVPLTTQKYNGNYPIKPIAFYLPQFHQIPLNDNNFGKGFTEWTNVAKAYPQFTGHYQPHIPIDVGFYDLSHDDVMYRQVELAKMYGIYGFCFHYYWFSGKRLLEKPIFNWLNNKELNLPFCLCWANENWSKLWDGGNKEVIMEQKLNDDDDEKFFADILPFFQDERYIKINNKPILLIYNVKIFSKERLNIFLNKITQLAKANGFNGIHILGCSSFGFSDYKNYDLDGLVEFPPHFYNIVIKKASCGYINKNFIGNVFDISSYIKEKEYMQIKDCNLYRTVFCGWDNTARKAKSNASVFLCNPQLYKEWFGNLVKWTQTYHKKQEQFIFINAWNEWAEGTHLEPDMKYGYAYLQATKEVLEEIENV